MKRVSHRSDIEARVPDTDRDPLGADTSSAASFGVASLIASGSARLFGPEGVRRSRLVRGEGPRVSGERPRVMPGALQVATSDGGRVSPPAKSQPDGSVSLVAEFLPISDRAGSPVAVAFGGGVRSVGKRVDALVVAFKVGVFPAVADEVAERQALADVCGAAELRLGKFRFGLRRTRARSMVIFENADVRGVYDPLACGGFVLEVIVRATHLATHALSESVTLCDAIARAFGPIRDCRLRRFDIAVDYAGFALSPGDVDRVLTTRSRIHSFHADPKDVDEASGELAGPIREHRDSVLRVTGITVAAGNPLMARVYAKDVELRHAGREEKREIEHRIWSDCGWDGDNR